MVTNQQSDIGEFLITAISVFSMIQISTDFYDMRMCLPSLCMLGDDADI